jgi:tetratricopeptide (TPR) repeat protein
MWINVKAGEDNKIIISLKRKISQIPKARAPEPKPSKKPKFKKYVGKENKESDTDLLNKGHFYRDRGEYKKAIEYYLQILQRNPYVVETVYCLGFAYLQLGNSDKAVGYFKQAIKIDPYNAESYYNLGLVYFIIEDKESAVELHKELRNIDKVLADRLLKYIDILD